jgi:hypothetical protein
MTQFIAGQPNYQSHKSTEKGLKDFLLGYQTAQLKSANEQLAEKAKQIALEGLKNQQDATKVNQLTQTLNEHMDNFSNVVNKTPLPEINPYNLPPIQNGQIASLGQSMGQNMPQKQSNVPSFL